MFRGRKTGTSGTWYKPEYSLPLTELITKLTAIYQEEYSPGASKVKLNQKDLEVLRILLSNLWRLYRYSKDKTQVLIPLNQRVYQKGNADYNFDDLVDTFHTPSRLKKLLDFLKHYNIIHFSKNNTHKSPLKTSNISLNIDINSWFLWNRCSQEEIINIIGDFSDFTPNKLKIKEPKAPIGLLDVPSEPEALRNFLTIMGAESSKRTARRILTKINSHLPHDALKYSRIFNNFVGKGGRYFSKFNLAPKALRNVLVDKLGLVELDYTAFSLNIMSIFATETYEDRKFYDEITDHLRLTLPFKLDKHHIKRVSTFIFNSPNLNYCVNWVAKALEVPLSTQKNPKHCAHKIVLKCLECLPHIRPFAFNYNWGWFQFVESEITTKLLIHMIKDNLLPLSTHDSIYVPLQYSDKYAHLMQNIIKSTVLEFKSKLLNTIDIIDNSRFSLTQLSPFISI